MRQQSTFSVKGINELDKLQLCVKNTTFISLLDFNVMFIVDN